MTKDAWEALDEFTSTGQITLSNGKVTRPEKDDPTCKTLVDCFKWQAQLQGKPRKTPKAMDDWKPAETK